MSTTREPQGQESTPQAGPSLRELVIANAAAALLLALLLLGAGLAVGAWLGSIPNTEDSGIGPYLGCSPGQEVKNQGDRLRTAVDAYYSAHGMYPQSLAEAGVALADMATEFGDWRLVLLSDGSAYELGVGDYGHNGFVLFWSCERHEWCVDT